MDQARVLAMRTAMEAPGAYGRRYSEVPMAFEVAGEEETEDHYVISLSFRPQGEFAGTPGREQFFVEKEGTIAVRQVMGLPRPAGARRLRIALAIIGVAVVVAAAVGGVIFAGRGGEGEAPVVKLNPTNTPAPNPTVNPQTPPTAALSESVALAIAPAMVALTPAATVAATPTPTPLTYPPGYYTGPLIDAHLQGRGLDYSVTGNTLDPLVALLPRYDIRRAIIFHADPDKARRISDRFPESFIMFYQPTEPADLQPDYVRGIFEEGASGVSGILTSKGTSYRPLIRRSWSSTPL